MELAFLFIAEAYQCYHGAAIALATGSLGRACGVVVYVNDPQSPAHLARIADAYGAPPAGRAPAASLVADAAAANRCACWA